MNKMKKILLLTTCAFVLLGTTACSSKDNADNGADQSNTNGDGILDDTVDDVTDGVDDVTDDVTDGIDKATDNMTEDNGVQKDTQNNR